jgi:hypothetical protein
MVKHFAYGFNQFLGISETKATKKNAVSAADNQKNQLETPTVKPMTMIVNVLRCSPVCI